jgi:uncharacterized membrane protein YgdD (TMEM256/DUF423 family)
MTIDPANSRPGAPSVMTRALASSGAVLAAASVALSAYAAHGAAGDAQASLQQAALFAFVHGIALAALAPRATRALARLALAALLLGVLLFSGSLAGAHWLDMPTRWAPMGGGLMILAWLVYAVDAARR